MKKDNESQQPPIRAGQAFAEAMEHDPKAKAAWKRAQANMRAFATMMEYLTNSPEYREAEEAKRQSWQEFADALRESAEAAGDELEARHFARPKSIEDWEHLARIVEIPEETTRKGNLTASEIFACALAWADRQTIKAKLTASAAPPPAPTSTPAPAPAPTAKPQTDENEYEDDAEYADMGGPISPPYDTRVAIWAGKRIYLGNDTEVSRLFWLLAKPVGRAVSRADVERAIDDVEMPFKDTPDSAKKMAQRVRKAISKLRAALRDADLDEHVLIVKGGHREAPEYSIVSRFGK